MVRLCLSRWKSVDLGPQLRKVFPNTFRSLLSRQGKNIVRNGCRPFKTADSDRYIFKVVDDFCKDIFKFLFHCTRVWQVPSYVKCIECHLETIRDST